MDENTGFDIALNLRVRQVRKALKLSQRKFSTLLSLSDSYIGGVEAGLREVNRRLVKLIASEFNASEEWLLNGSGEMFVEHSDEKFSKLLSLFKELPPKYQQVVFKLIEVLRKLDDPPPDTE